MRWTAWCATTAPVETGSTTTTASAPGTDKPASAALATSSALARLTVGTSSYVCAVGREEETARGRPPFSHSRYSVSMPMRHAVRSNLSSAESGQLSYQATRRSGALPHLSCIHLRCGPLFTTGVGDSFTFRMSGDERALGGRVADGDTIRMRSDPHPPTHPPPHTRHSQ